MAAVDFVAVVGIFSQFFLCACTLVTLDFESRNFTKILENRFWVYGLWDGFSLSNSSSSSNINRINQQSHMYSNIVEAVKIT